MARWKCQCGEWVDERYPSHTHANIHQRYDEAMKKWVNTLGQPLDIWTYERKPDDLKSS